MRSQTLCLKATCFSSKIKSKTRNPLLSPLFTTVLEVRARAIRQEKWIKCIQIRNEIKLSLFPDDMIQHVGKP